ncbi:hypothetical protein SAMN05216371_7393 [Streptomyces sp. TLI_053]|uniref:hypothetical protein n=1 Tax=Streptomyces sp. TLI_053 TaxID=1855352 RepID=UPI00087A984C|nr:hypothetical protein [Streptomyces sp. TLI_053]SDT82603.1 hypothetical protein SAMN05216371_7393 [Streptomyces sp. TLI_053]
MTTDPVAPSPVDAPPPTPPAGAPELPSGPPEATPAAPSEAPPARTPRRPRPVLLLVSGLVLGTVAGGGAGYAIQANRPPTPLPPIQVALPSYPAGALDPAVAAAAAPSPLAIDGDLRKLLIAAPSGSTAWGDYPDTPSWITAGELAEHDGMTAAVFKQLNTHGFRRAVEIDWKQGDLKVRISLIQYTADRAAEAGARTLGRSLEPFAPEANGGYQVDSRASYWAETTEPYYGADAVAQRGTVVMEVKVFGTRPVSPEVVKDLAKRQWERLA